MKANILAMALLLAGGVARADAPSAPSSCAVTACRTGGYDLSIRLDDSRHIATVTVPQTPYVLASGAVLIFPGETIAVQFTLDGGKIAGPPKFVARLAPQLPVPLTKDGMAFANPEDASLPAIKGEKPSELMAGLPPNTLLISYGQSANTTGMALEIYSSLPQMLKLDATLATLTDHGYGKMHSSTCPIMSGGLGDESWPNPLGPMLLTNFRLIAEGSTMSCD